jgi:hypothetical protein
MEESTNAWVCLENVDKTTLNIYDTRRLQTNCFSNHFRNLCKMTVASVRKVITKSPLLTSNKEEIRTNVFVGFYYQSSHVAELNTHRGEPIFEISVVIL